MTDATQRVNYFDRQFLRAADFQVEQAYDLDRRRRHNRLLHAPGVAEGLQVSGNVGDGFVTVSPGTAYDALGQEIVLAGSEQVDVSAVAGATAYVTITYSEQASDPSADPGVTGDTRISEQPGLAASATLPANPNLVLPLASVALASGKVSGPPDNTVRTQAASVVVVPQDLGLRSVTLQNPLVAQPWPQLVCSGTNTATLHNAGLSLDVSAAGALGPQLTLTNTAGGGANAAASVDFNTFSPSSSGIPSARIEAVDDGHSGNDIVFSSNTPAPNPTLVEKFRIKSSGDASITGNLTISGLNAGLSLDVPAVGELGPKLTLTNTAVSGANAAASIDFNTFSPSSSGTYNPSARIEAVDDGHSGNAIVFSSNNPGAPNSGLAERVRITSSGDASINGNLKVEGQNNLTVGGQATVTNNLTVGSQAVTNDLTVGGQATVANNLTVGSQAVTNDLTVGGQATVTNNLSVAGQASVTRNLSVGAVIPGNTDPLTVFIPGHEPPLFVSLGRATSAHGCNSIYGSTDLWLECDTGSNIYLNGTVQGPPGSDFAERFPAKEAVGPGEVVIFDHALGGVVPCDRVNDKRAVGIVSGAPAFTLGMEADEPAIALCGRLLCKVDADIASIAPGDLLTTSSTRGHAQKADPAQAVGAIIGKALEPLCSGRGKILVLVTIQ